MESQIKTAFAGNSENFESYRKTLNRFDTDVVFSGAWFSNEKPENYTENEFESYDELLENSDAVFFFGDKIRKKLIADAIKSCKHIFIDDYSSLLNSDVRQLYELASEADIAAQVSFPKTYFWGIEDLPEEHPKIRNIFFYREYIYHQQKQETDLMPEILSSIKLINDDVIRANSLSIPMIPKRTEMKVINLEFRNGAASSITGVPVGFVERHDLRIIAERSLAYVDLRRREWHSLKPAKAITGKLIKGLAGLPEVGDIEQFEIQDFIDSIKDRIDPFVSFKDMVDLNNCLKLIEDK